MTEPSITLMPNNLFLTMALRQIHPEKLESLQVIAADQQQLATHPQRRMEQLISRSWRRQILAAQLHQTPDNLCFVKDAYGKPYLMHYPALQFSQSHCTEQFVLAFNQQGIALGVDIEAKRRVINQARLARRILTASEMQVFTHTKDPQAYLLKCWTIKEAVLKACGLGIRLNLNTLETENKNSLFNRIENTDTAIKNRDIQHGVSTAYHAAIGEWAYLCFETAGYYCTVAWQNHLYHPVSVNWLP